MKLPVVFALLTALFWGMYGPALGESRKGLHSAFKPYVMIGVAYLIWGVVGGLIGMGLNRDDFSFSGSGTIWGFIAGSLGAWGAFTLTLAMFSGGIAMPHIVMPIVFGGAVTVSAIVSLIQTQNAGSPLLWVGIIVVGAGIVLVAANTPHGGPGHKQKSDAPAETAQAEH